MQHLLQFPVVRTASLAAMLTSMACYPRLSLWTDRPYPIWFLEGMLFCCSGVLWGFVFAWHAEYSKRPVITLKLQRNDLLSALGAGLAIALLLHFVFDPVLRTQAPKDYPATLQLWIAMSLFSAALQPLFFLFAPFAFFLRLSKNRQASLVLTLLFVMLMVTLKAHQSQVVLSTGMAAGFLLTRIVASFLALHFYLRGGLLLALFWGVPIQLRFLIDLLGN